MIKVEVDKELCTECGLCYSFCEVFEPDESGRAQIADKYRLDGSDQGLVPEATVCVQQSAENCPVEAIILG